MKEKCEYCNGTGLEICIDCDGRGWFKNPYTKKHHDCDSCGGDGKAACGVCQGTGMKVETTT